MTAPETRSDRPIRDRARGTHARTHTPLRRVSSTSPDRAARPVQPSPRGPSSPQQCGWRCRRPCSLCQHTHSSRQTPPKTKDSRTHTKPDPQPPHLSCGDVVLRPLAATTPALDDTHTHARTHARSRSCALMALEPLLPPMLRFRFSLAPRCCPRVYACTVCRDTHRCWHVDFISQRRCALAPSMPTLLLDFF